MKLNYFITLNKNLSLNVLALLAAVSMSGCTKKDVACSSPSNINDPVCQKQIPDVNQVPVTLNITYADSYFFDQNSNAWNTITKANLSGGTTGFTVPIYSNFLSADKQTSLASSISAKDQKDRPEIYSSFNNVPYIEIVPETGAEYLYDYVKRDLNNTVIYEKNGTVPVINGRVVLPLVNVMFDGNFYSTNSALGSRFIHSITFAAQSATKRGTLSSTINFETSFNIPPTDYLTDYTTGAMPKFSLDKRWQFYFNGTDYNPNTGLKFFTLKQNKAVSEQIPLDFKVVFQTPPVLKMDQELFFELPFDLDTFQSNNVINPSRGNHFYSKISKLDSSTDFKMNMNINGVVVPLTNTKELEYLNLPANTPWDIDFSYDFTQNQGFVVSASNGVGLLSPLKPMCSQFSNTNYNPILEESAKSLAVQNGGYISICHPKANKKHIFSQSTVTSTALPDALSLSDTWYNFFSYVPFNSYKKELGHFYGLKTIKFYTSGCLRLYTREPGTSSYILASKGSTGNKCGTDSSGGWVYYTAEKTFTIFDLTNNYINVDGLTPLIQAFSTSPSTTYDHFKFNTLDNDVHHIY